MSVTTLPLGFMFGAFPFLVKPHADAGYQGQKFQTPMKRILAQVNVGIVKRSDQAKGFVTLPKALDRRTHPRLARPLPQGACLSAPRLHPPHAVKATQSRMLLPDRLLD
jgi:hypothetical protein